MIKYEAKMIPVDKIQPSRYQVREEFEDEEHTIEELAATIKKYGLLQPVLVVERKDYYELVFGERRWRAVKLLGWKEIPAFIASRDIKEKDIAFIGLIENIARKDLTDGEKAKGILLALEISGLKIPEDKVREYVKKIVNYEKYYKKWDI